MIVFGYRTAGERVSSIAPLICHCPACGCAAEFVVKARVTRFTLYWIPTFKISGGKDMYQQCQSCQTAFVYTPKRTAAA